MSKEAKTKYVIIIGGLLYIVMTAYAYLGSRPSTNLRYLAWLMLNLLMAVGIVALLLRNMRGSPSLSVKQSTGLGRLAIAALLLFGAQQVVAYWGTQPGLTMHFVYLVCGVGIVVASVAAIIEIGLRSKLTLTNKKKS